MSTERIRSVGGEEIFQEKMKTNVSNERKQTNCEIEEIISQHWGLRQITEEEEASRVADLRGRTVKK